MEDHNRFPLLRKIVLSPYLDLFGACLILGITIVRGFQNTIYVDDQIQTVKDLPEWISQMKNNAYPLGILSMIGAVFSLLSTRLVGKQKNSGNFIGILTTINSGINDFLFGNISAVLTYPISFAIQNFSFFNWKKGVKIRKVDFWYYVINISGIIISYLIVYLGFYLFGGETNDLFFHSIALTFGLSLGANFSNALKYEETWLSWTIYNVIQIIKNSIQMNIANVVKYVFYLFNAIVTFFDWRLNGDRK